MTPSRVRVSAPGRFEEDWLDKVRFSFDDKCMYFYDVFFSCILFKFFLMTGVTAKDSKRGSQSLNTFIRNDKDRADIQLTLFNGGPDAYKPEVYGSVKPHSFGFAFGMIIIISK